MCTLLVEDNPRLSASLLRGFAECKLAVEAVGSGRAALERLAKRDCDAMILDLGLPDIDGSEVLTTARAMGITIPVIVLSARGSVEERVLALDAGADDYLVKPFELAELIARLRALARRSSAPRLASLQLGNLNVHADEPRVQVGARSVALSPREHALLQHLMRHAGQIARRSEILSAVFGYGFDPGTNLIDVHVAHLRRKLAGASVQLETVRGQGFRLRSAAMLGVSDTSDRHAAHAAAAPAGDPIRDANHRARAGRAAAVAALGRRGACGGNRDERASGSTRAGFRCAG
jgi:DNA-binding response OmpR family regulator